MKTIKKILATLAVMIVTVTGVFMIRETIVNRQEKEITVVKHEDGTTFISRNNPKI